MWQGLLTPPTLRKVHLTRPSVSLVYGTAFSVTLLTTIVQLNVHTSTSPVREYALGIDNTNTGNWNSPRRLTLEAFRLADKLL